MHKLKQISSSSSALKIANIVREIAALSLPTVPATMLILMALKRPRDFVSTEWVSQLYKDCSTEACPLLVCSALLLLLFQSLSIYKQVSPGYRSSLTRITWKCWWSTEDCAPLLLKPTHRRSAEGIIGFISGQNRDKTSSICSTFAIFYLLMSCKWGTNKQCELN